MLPIQGMNVGVVLERAALPSSRILMEDLKLMQKLRQRKNGVTAEELALGKNTQSSMTVRKAEVSVLLHKEAFYSDDLLVCRA